jgi:CheY-like chemotaxis protein
MSETVRLLERPILLAASEPDDVWIARAALERVGWPVAPAEDAVAGMQALCEGAGQFAAVVVGERVGRVSGLAFCGLARDAGCTLPALLLTADAHAALAVRAARLHVTVLWHPVSPSSSGGGVWNSSRSSALVCSPLAVSTTSFTRRSWSTARRSARPNRSRRSTIHVAFEASHSHWSATARIERPSPGRGSTGPGRRARSDPWQKAS